MKTQNGQLARLSVLVLSLLGIGATTQAQNNVDFRVGDVLAAVGNGTYQVYDPGFGTLLGSIQSGSGDTRGCAIDSSYHPVTTDLSDALVDRWNVNSVPAPFNIPNQVISSINAAGQSLALDSLGNLYVGQPGGNGCVLEYNVSGNFLGNLPPKCSSSSTLKGGTPWIDLDRKASTVYFGNGSKTVSQFSVSCTKSPKSCISSFGPNFSAVYGVRVLTPDAVTGSGGSGYMLVAAGSQVALLSSSGGLIQSYTATNETDFEVLTLLPGGTQFAAGSPASHNIFVFNYASSTTGPPISLSAGPAGMCTYGLADAAQPQPQLANVLSCPGTGSGSAAVSPPGGTCNGYTSNTAAFNLPINPPSDASKLKLTFPDLNASGGSLTAHVTTVNPASVLSDPSVISSNTLLPEGGSFACTADPNNVCYIWEVEPVGITLGRDFTYADVSLNQGGPGDPTVHGLKNAAIDVTYLTGEVLDAGVGSRSSLSVYTLNNFVPSGGPNGGGDQVCSTKNNGYTSPVVAGETYNFGSVVPFKFQVAASQQDCKKGNFLTNLDSTAYLTLVQCDPTNGCSSFGSSNAPATAVVDIAGNSGAQPVYRLSTNQYIINVDSSNLTPGACYFASTSAPAITTFNTTFCLTSK